MSNKTLCRHKYKISSTQSNGNGKLEIIAFNCVKCDKLKVFDSYKGKFLTGNNIYR